MFRCDLSKRTSLGKGHGEGFIDNHILASAQGCGGERKMAFIRGGDHDQIDVWMGRHFRSETD